LILETVERICAEGVSVLLVEQNASAALAISHQAYVLETGRLVLEGLLPMWQGRKGEKGLFRG